MLQKHNKFKETIGLLIGFVFLAMMGYLIFQVNSIAGIIALIVSVVFAVLWLTFILISVKRDQWLPLLISTFYWLIASLVRLYLSNQLEEEERVMPELLNRLSEFAAGALSGLAYFSEDVIILVMAVITLLSMIGLIMVLDRNKPKTEDTNSDLYF